MPRFKKAGVWEPDSPASSLGPDSLVHSVPFTGECYESYDAYLDRVVHYVTRNWCCRHTGSQWLTFQDAQREEAEAEEALASFPRSHTEACLRAVHHSTDRLGDVAQKLLARFKSELLVGETGIMLKDEFKRSKAKGAPPACVYRVKDVLRGGDPKQYTYVLGPVNNEVDGGSSTTTTTAAFSAVYRRKQPILRETLLSYLRENTTRLPFNGSPYIVKPGPASAHMLPTKLPPALEAECKAYQDKIAAKETAKMAGAKRKAEAELRAAEKVKNAKRREEQRREREAAKKAKKEAEKRAQEALPKIKYPIEDNELTKKDRQDEGPRPQPSTDFLVPPARVHDLLSVWCFCYGFGQVLELSEFNLDMFQHALAHNSSNSKPEIGLLAEIIAALYNVARAPISHDPETEEEVWPEEADPRNAARLAGAHLAQAAASGDVPRAVYASVAAAAMADPTAVLASWTPARRLDLLMGLMDVACAAESVREAMDECFVALKDLRIQRRQETAQENKRRKDLRAQDRAVRKAANANGDGESGDSGSSSGSGSDSSSSEEEEEEESSEEEEEEEEAEALAPSPSKLQGRAGRRALMEWQKRLREAEEAKRQRAEDAARAEKMAARAEKMAAAAEERERQKEEAQLERERQEERARRQALVDEHLEALRQLDEAMLEAGIARRNALGTDRYHNQYYLFSGDLSRLYVTPRDHAKWGYYSTIGELDDLMAHLNEKGVRECALREALTDVRKILDTAMKKRQTEARRAQSQRSARVAARFGEDAYLYYQNTWK